MLISFGYASGRAQCDAQVSGVFAYCNSFIGSNTMPGFFIGFRIKSLTGDTLNVIDLTGNVPMNLGKRIDDINIQIEPIDTSRVPVQITGGADSLEYWYFGPFMDGDSFNIVLVDPTGVCDTIQVVSGTFTCQGQDPNACDSDVPLYVMDFSQSSWNIGGGGGGNENIDNVFLVMARQREKTCCFVGSPQDRCFEFLITLADDDVGIVVDDVGSGSTGGRIYADSLNNFACGPDQATTWPWFQDNGQSNDVTPICLPGTTKDWIVLSCKQGGNITNASIGAIGPPHVNPEYVYSDCQVQLKVLEASSAIWSSPDDPGLDNIINFDANHIVATFSYDEALFGPITSCEGDTFTYIVGAYPDNVCLPSNVYIYDTTFVVVYPDFSVTIHSSCIGSDSLLLSANVNSSANDCIYHYLWSTGETTSAIDVSNGPGEFSVSITRNDLASFVFDCSPANDNIIIVPTTIPVIPPDTICEGGSTQFLLVPSDTATFTYLWNYGSGSTPSTGMGPGPHSVSYITTTDNQANGAVVTLTIGQTGCPDVSGQVTQLDIIPLPPVSISGSTSNLCYYTNRTFQSGLPFIPGATYQWTFGAGAVPASATGYGPYTVYYTSAGVKTVTLTIYPNDAGAQCPNSASIMFTVLNCAANITGTVKSNTGTGIPGVNLKLYSDDNIDGIPDNDTIMKSVFTTTAGIYSMVGLIPGNYVIIEVQPLLWTSVDDEDTSDDGDAFPNLDSLDNLIPVTLEPSELDANNNFIESPLQGSIIGDVFNDLDNDQVPDSLEGLPGVTVSLFHDDNSDGIADNLVPISNVLTLSSGYYSFSNVPIGNYVLAETQPPVYISIKDYDETDDIDVVTNYNTNNDTIPVTITNENDAENYFIEGVPCILIVNNTLDSGPGSLRNAIACANQGDTIYFANSLSGMTITITSGMIMIDKEIEIISNLSPSLTINSEIPGLFYIGINEIVDLKDLNIISGMSVPGNMGAAFENHGELKLQDVHVLRNPALPPTEYLIRNTPNSHLFLSGNCFIDMY